MGLLHKLKIAGKEVAYKHFQNAIPQNNSTYLLRRECSSLPKAEAFFRTEDGRDIPVLPHHRYSLKDCWRMYGPLAALAELDDEGLLEQQDKNFLNHAKGTRTVMEPFSSIRACLSPYLERYADRFISATIPDIGKRFLMPKVASVEKKISKTAEKHAYLLQNLQQMATMPPKAGEAVLEIGYTSGGESILGFERLGFNACGIDNFYGDSIDATSRHTTIAKIAKSSACFLRGDIRKPNPDIAEARFSLIYSLSVLEHIDDLPSAFSEMYRILRPGGVMYHHYDPYFYIRGAHAGGTLDSPWAHMRLTRLDVESYIRTFRQHEAEVVFPWLRGGLNRTHFQSHVLEALSCAGFNILHWKTTQIPQTHMDMLTMDIARECFAINPGITLSDLTSSSVAFIAEKPITAG